MSGASFRKIGFFKPGRRLAAPEGPKIAEGGLAGAKEKKPGNSRPSVRRKGFETPWPSPIDPDAA